MRRYGDAARFTERIERIRELAPDAALRSSFILGYPGETEEDHDTLLGFLEEARLDWAGFFTFSEEEGTYASGLGDKVPADLAAERLRECAELQDADHGVAAPGARRGTPRRARRLARGRPLASRGPGDRRRRQGPGVARHRQLRLRRGRRRRGTGPRRTGPRRRRAAGGARGGREGATLDGGRRVSGEHGSGKLFGPSAVATPANALSMARVVAAPVLAVLIGESRPSWSWLLWSLWTVLAGSDGLDGHLARRQGATRSGAFLDPLADKVLVLAALAALGGVGYVSWWPVALIAVREGRDERLSRLRREAGRVGPGTPARQGEDLHPGPGGRLRTLPPDRPAPGCGRVILWVAVAFTLATGVEYFMDGRRLLRAAPAVPGRVAGGPAA